MVGVAVCQKLQEKNQSPLHTCTRGTTSIYILITCMNLFALRFFTAQATQWGHVEHSQFT